MVFLVGMLRPLQFIRSTMRIRLVLAFLAGLALAAAFPKFNVPGTAWVAPGLILAAAHGFTRRQQFTIGFAGGLAFQLGTLHWLLYIPVRGFPILGWVALSAYMGLYTGAWVCLAWRVFPGAGRTQTNSPTLVESFGQLNWSGRFQWCFIVACLWVALEMIAARFLSGFPWTILGVSQAGLLPLIQISSLTGIYGMSFLPVWTSLALLCAGVMLLRQPTQRWVWLSEILPPLLVAGVIAVWGWNRIKHANDPTETISAALIQPSIPQTMIWDTKENDVRFKRLIALSEQALTNHPDLLIWPEAAVPNLLRWDRTTYDAVTLLAASNQVWIILGADDAEPIKETPDPNDANWFNSSFLVDPGGKIVTSYRKQRLVIFGEYVPLVRWLPFLKFLTPIDGGFTAGKEPRVFDLERQPSDQPEDEVDVGQAGAGTGAPSIDELGVKTSVLICFEDVFPHHARKHVSDDLDFLINLTNDGWFGESSAQYQQAANAAFRAVENGIPLVRCTNNGLTCWIDQYGRMRDRLWDVDRGIYGEGFLLTRLPKLGEGQTRPGTFYRQHGDWFGWGCVIISIAAVARRYARHKRAHGMPGNTMTR